MFIIDSKILVAYNIILVVATVKQQDGKQKENKIKTKTKCDGVIDATLFV